MRMRIMLSTAIVMLASHAALCVVLSQTPREETWVTDGIVHAIVQDGDKVYLGGEFSYVGPNSGHFAVLDTATGMPRASFPRVNGTVRSIASDTKGGWFIGGTFTQIGTCSRNHIAHILSDYSVDTSWNPNASNCINAIAVSGNNVYVGGYFDFIGGQARNNIASLDATTGMASDWNPNTVGQVLAISVSGNNVYIGGGFKTIGGQARNYIACIDAITGLTTDWNPNANYDVHALHAVGNNVYVGGWFTSIGGQSRNYIACIDATTGLATDWNPNANSEIFALSVSGNNVYAGGSFTSIGGLSRKYIACIDVTTGIATGWNPNVSGSVLDLSVSGNSVLIGGDFISIGGQSRNNIACINATTGFTTDWNPNVDAIILALSIRGNHIYAGGWFSTIGGQKRENIACIDATTGLATDWNPKANHYVYTLSISGNNVYAGGVFNSIGGQARNHIACIDATTGLATDWNPNAKDPFWTYYVTALYVSGNSVYAGGRFTTIGEQTRNNIACIDATTGLATDWNPNADDDVQDLIVCGNNIYVGGLFGSIGGQTRNNFACLDATTGLASDWNTSADDGIFAISASGNNIYVGGSFKTICGQERNCIASLDATTGHATGWIPNPDYRINAICVSENSVYVGGSFTTIGGSSCPSFAQFDFITPQPPHITSITPDTQAIANGTIHISAIAGTNLNYVASAKLVKSGNSDIIATKLSIVSSTRITCDFNLDSADTGSWDVIVSDQENQSDTLVNGFTIIERALPYVPILIAPSESAVNQPFSLAFRWHYAERATAYDCQVALDSDFTSLIIDTTSLYDTAATFSIPRESFCIFYWRVRAVNPSGNGQWSDTWSFTSGNSPVRFNGDKALTNSFTFSPSTRTIRYSLAHSSPVSLRVFDMRGRQMASLINRYQVPGTYAVSLGSQSLPMGFYIFSFRAGNFTAIRRCALVR